MSITEGARNRPQARLAALTQKVTTICLPNGKVLTKNDLPSADATKRWTINNKAAVVIAVIDGMLTPSEAQSRWQLSLEELLLWTNAYKKYGLPGLKTTKIQKFRRIPVMAGKAIRT